MNLVTLARPTYSGEGSQSRSPSETRPSGPSRVIRVYQMPGENGLIEPELLGDPPVQGEPVFITGMLRLKERDVPLDCLKQL